MGEKNELCERKRKKERERGMVERVSLYYVPWCGIEVCVHRELKISDFSLSLKHSLSHPHARTHTHTHSLIHSSSHFFL